MSSNGQIVLHNGSPGTADLVADVDGYYGAGANSAYLPLFKPQRLVDTRPDGVPMGSILPPLPFSGQGDGVTAGVLNATVTQPASSGFLSFYPYEPSDPTAKPTTSNVNFSKGETIPNLVIASPGTQLDPSYDAYDVGVYFGGAGNTQLVLDLFGFFENQ